MDAKKQLELAQFQQVSQQMLAFAKKGDWEQLPDLEVQRKKIIVSFFDKPVAAQNALQVEQVVTDILSMNKMIEGLAQQEKETIGQQLHSLKKKQNVHSAYLQNK